MHTPRGEAGDGEGGMCWLLRTDGQDQCMYGLTAASYIGQFYLYVIPDSFTESTTGTLVVHEGANRWQLQQCAAAPRWPTCTFVTAALSRRVTLLLFPTVACFRSPVVSVGLWQAAVCACKSPMQCRLPLTLHWCAPAAGNTKLHANQPAVHQGAGGSGENSYSYHLPQGSWAAVASLWATALAVLAGEVPLSALQRPATSAALPELCQLGWQSYHSEYLTLCEHCSCSRATIFAGPLACTYSKSHGRGALYREAGQNFQGAIGSRGFGRQYTQAMA